MPKLLGEQRIYFSDITALLLVNFVNEWKFVNQSHMKQLNRELLSV